jgi:hypothetical protein
MPNRVLPSPPELAAQIVAAVSEHVEFELAPLEAHLREQLEEPSEEYIWERAERIVRDEIDASWMPEVVAQCERALAEALQDLALVPEQRRGALEDLRRNGRESWIYGAIRHHLAFETTWEVLTERDE